MEQLIAHVKAENEKTRAWVAAGPDRWASEYSEDPQDWIDRGITTVEQFERDNLETYIYEAHKDAFGFKGRHYNFSEMSLEDLKHTAEYISEAVARSIEEDKAMEQAAIEMFKIRISDIKELISGCDDERAVHFLADAEGEDEDSLRCYGWEGLEYTLGLPFGYIKKFLEA